MPFAARPDARIAYARTGDGPPVLLIQGVGVVGQGWRPQVDALCDAFSLISFDNRGIGASTMNGPALTIEMMAADALSILDAERIDRCHVVGHSMGGVIAQALALQAPERIASLSLLCTFARGRDAVALTPALLWLGMRTRIGTRAMRRRAFLQLVAPETAHAGAEADRLAAELAPLFGHDLADQPPIAMKQLRATSRYDAFDRLDTLRSIPTLVVSAALDHIARPPTGRALAQAIPGARYVELPHVGHGVPLRQPALVNDLLRDHFTRAETSRRA
jgi:pimeloyl-ACP methyl ester carboxylesterase